jgi:hypothetical protein
MRRDRIPARDNYVKFENQQAIGVELFILKKFFAVGNFVEFYYMQVTHTTRIPGMATAESFDFQQDKLRRILIPAVGRLILAGVKCALEFDQDYQEETERNLNITARNCTF